MNCIAIDDEPIALGIIKKYCERMGDMSLETFTNPHLGLRRIIEEKPDIVFLDIEMNGMSGMELARRYPTASVSSSPPPTPTMRWRAMRSMPSTSCTSRSSTSDLSKPSTRRGSGSRCVR